MGPDREAEAAVQLQRRQAFWAALVAGCTALQAMRAAVLRRRETAQVTSVQGRLRSVAGVASSVPAMHGPGVSPPALWRQHAAMQQAVCLLCTPAAAAFLTPGRTAAAPGRSTVAASALGASVLLATNTYWLKHLTCAGGSSGNLEVEYVQDCYARHKA